jgi:hypothetical protein
MSSLALLNDLDIPDRHGFPDLAANLAGAPPRLWLLIMP